MEDNIAEMSDIRVNIWFKKMSQKKVITAPDLKVLPPTMEALKENGNRAYFQATIWKSASSANPPVDATKYGWSRDNASKTLRPVTLSPDVAFAALSVLELVKCCWASKEPCKNAKCGCEAAHLPCTFFCSCNRCNVCLNPYNKQYDSDKEDDGSSEISEL